MRNMVIYLITAAIVAGFTAICGPLRQWFLWSWEFSMLGGVSATIAVLSAGGFLSALFVIHENFAWERSFDGLLLSFFVGGIALIFKSIPEPGLLGGIQAILGVVFGFGSAIIYMYYRTTLLDRGKVNSQS